MKKILKLSLIAMLVSSSAYSVVGNDPLSSAEGDARINMIRPLTLLQTQSINFGDVAVDGGGVIGMVQVSGAITCHGFRSHSCPATGITGEFSISGKSNTSVAVSITANATMCLAPSGWVLKILEVEDYLFHNYKKQLLDGENHANYTS